MTENVINLRLVSDDDEQIGGVYTSGLVFLIQDEDDCAANNLDHLPEGDSWIWVEVEGEESGSFIKRSRLERVIEILGGSLQVEGSE